MIKKFTTLLIISGLIFLIKPVHAYDTSNVSATVGSFTTSSTTLSVGYRINSVFTMGSVKLEFCSNSPNEWDACTAPTGLNVGSIAMTGQTTNTGFSLLSNTSNQIILTRTVSNSTLGDSVLDFSNFVPSTDLATVYVRLAFFDDTAAVGSLQDRAAAAFSKGSALTVDLSVPPYMTFCVGVVVAVDCSTAEGQFVDLGNLSATQANVGTSQYAVQTNFGLGHTVVANGPTMSSGSNILNPMTGQGSNPGTSQFGVNLVQNTAPQVGQPVGGTGNATPKSIFSIANQFNYADGVALSGSSTSTEFSRFTVSYLANVGKLQPPGYYATIVLFTAIPNF